MSITTTDPTVATVATATATTTSGTPPVTTTATVATPVSTAASTTYSFKDRLKEFSSYIGLAMVGLALYLGYKVTPASPEMFLPVAIAALGAFGIAVPDQKTTAQLEALLPIVLAAIEQSKTAVKGMLLPFLVGLPLMAGLAACGADPSQDLGKSLLAACAVYGNSLNTAAILRQQGVLTSSLIKQISAIDAKVGNTCDPALTPTVASAQQTALNLVLAQAQSLNQLLLPRIQSAPTTAVKAQ